MDGPTRGLVDRFKEILELALAWVLHDGVGGGCGQAARLALQYGFLFRSMFRPDPSRSYSDAPHGPAARAPSLVAARRLLAGRNTVPETCRTVRFYLVEVGGEHVASTGYRW